MPDGVKLVSLREARAPRPASERSMPVVLTAAELITSAAEHGGLSSSRIATLQAINRNVEPVFDHPAKILTGDAASWCAIADRIRQAAKGLDNIEPLLVRVAQDESLPALARELFVMEGREYAQLQVELKAIEAKLMAWHRANACSQHLAQIPGLGTDRPAALVMKTPDPRAFPSGRHFAAWLGLTPKDHSTAGKTRLSKITRAGDEVLRSLLVVGATAVIQQVGSKLGCRTDAETGY